MTVDQQREVLRALEPWIPPLHGRAGLRGRRLGWYVPQLPRRLRWKQMRGVGAFIWGPNGRPPL